MSAYDHYEALHNRARARRAKYADTCIDIDEIQDSREPVRKRIGRQIDLDYDHIEAAATEHARPRNTRAYWLGSALSVADNRHPNQVSTLLYY